ncbi:autotransporter outer membrane beta-barrel domain-containing protein, partial [Aliarcobacter skirrowii]|uniref:autotransporter outer membrane beta-barrel domain-containing protein n=1 Tax=Aliarcobacter skirrowii TaxID=28200 RepID=UPI000A45047D
TEPEPTEPTEEEAKKKAEEEEAKKKAEEEEAKKKAEVKLKKTIAALQKLKTKEEIEKAIDSLNPYIHLYILDISKTTNNNINSILKDVNKKEDSFVKFLNGKTTQKDEYKHKYRTLALGFNKEYKEEQFYTLAAFYTNSNAKLEGDLIQEAEIDTYSLALEGLNNLKNNYYINYNLIYSLNKVNTKRELFTKETAKANFNNNTITANLEVGKEISLNNKHSLTPNLGLKYNLYNSKSYKETGAEAALKIGNKKTDEITASLGVEYKYKIDEDKTLSVSPKVGYVLKEADKKYGIGFVEIEDSKFYREATSNGKYVYNAKIGYTQNITKNQNLGASLEYTKHKNYNNSNIAFSYQLKF